MPIEAAYVENVGSDMLVQDQRRRRYVMKRLISLLAAVTAVVMFALPGSAQTTIRGQ